jgi:hypothetical protein
MVDFEPKTMSRKIVQNRSEIDRFRRARRFSRRAEGFLEVETPFAACFARFGVL